MNEKETYVKPQVEIVEFVFEESIAASNVGAIFNEDIWGV